MKITDNPILNELTENDIEYTVTKEGIRLDGFYKSGSILLVLDENNTFMAIARYEEKTKINYVGDLIELNYNWWLWSKNRFGGWRYPDDKWLNLFNKLNLVVE